MSGATSPEEVRLRRLEELVDAWKARILELAEDGDPESIDGAYSARFQETAQRLLHLNDQLHAEDFDPEALAEIRDILLKGIAALENIDESRPLDAVDDFLVRAEAIRHLIRDAVDGHVTGAPSDARAVVERLHEWLPRTTQVDLAKLVGRSPRQLQRWAKEGGQPSRRLQLVARLVAILQRGWSEEGVIAWFYRPRWDLENEPAIELLDMPEQERRVIVAARQGRAEHGS